MAFPCLLSLCVVIGSDRRVTTLKLFALSLVKTRGERIFTKDGIAEDGFFTGDIVICDNNQSGTLQSAAAVALSCRY